MCSAVRRSRVRIFHPLHSGIAGQQVVVVILARCQVVVGLFRPSATAVLISNPLGSHLLSRETLDSSSGLTNKSKNLNMTSLLKTLKRPQFANIKNLALPRNVKLGKQGVKQLGKILPNLESLDIGFSLFSGGPCVSDEELVSIVNTLPNLGGLATDMWKVSNRGLEQLATTMNERLVSLKIKGDVFSRVSLSLPGLDLCLLSLPTHFSSLSTTCPIKPCRLLRATVLT